MVFGNLLMVKYHDKTCQLKYMITQEPFIVW